MGGGKRKGVWGEGGSERDGTDLGAHIEGLVVARTHLKTHRAQTASG